MTFLAANPPPWSRTRTCGSLDRRVSGTLAGIKALYVSLTVAWRIG